MDKEALRNWPGLDFPPDFSIVLQQVGVVFA